MRIESKSEDIIIFYYTKS